MYHLLRRHPRGWCGLKSLFELRGMLVLRRHPRGWCGLKSLFMLPGNSRSKSPPARVVWIEIGQGALESYKEAESRHPRGWCGLKLIRYCYYRLIALVATREGGVD